MRLDVGPVAPASAVAWLGWADEVYGDLGDRPASAVSAATGLSADVVSYLHRWIAHAGGVDQIYRWQAEVDPDELEYLVHAFCSLDAQMSAEGVVGEQPPVPEESRAFYLVLVGAPPARPRDGESQSGRLRGPVALVLAQRSRGQLKGAAGHASASHA